MRTSPLSITCAIAVAIAATGCTSGRTSAHAGADHATMTTAVSPVDSRVLAAFRGALDAEYAVGSEPAVAGDMAAANAVGRDPRLSSAFTGVAYTQTWTGIANSHMNGVQGPSTYTLAEARVSSLTPVNDPTSATVSACFFDAGDFVTATHAPVTAPAGTGAGWAFGTWTLTMTDGTWKVSDDHYQVVLTNDGAHPRCG